MTRCGEVWSHAYRERRPRAGARLLLPRSSAATASESFSAASASSSTLAPPRACLCPQRPYPAASSPGQSAARAPPGHAARCPAAAHRAARCRLFARAATRIPERSLPDTQAPPRSPHFASAARRSAKSLSGGACCAPARRGQLAIPCWKSPRTCSSVSSILSLPICASYRAVRPAAIGLQLAPDAGGERIKRARYAVFVTTEVPT